MAKVDVCNLIVYFLVVIYIAALVCLPVGIGIFVSYKNGKFGEYDIYRSGYLCGAQPPTAEDIAARNDIPTCLKFKDNRGPLCLQAGKLDKPAVWCNEGGYKRFLWWSPCSKCGTAWRIFKEMDNDQSWYKRLTSPQPNNSAVPPEDGWLEWDQYNEEWEDFNTSISTCSSWGAGYYNEEDVNDNNNSTHYAIPNSCYSKRIYVGINPWYRAGKIMLIIGCIFWGIPLCTFLQEKFPNDGGEGNYGGGGGGKPFVLIAIGHAYADTNN